MPRYLVTIGQKEYDVALEYHSEHYVVVVAGNKSVVKCNTLGDSRSLLLIDNQVHEVDVRQESGPNTRLVFMGGREIPLTIEAYNIAKLRKMVNNNNHTSAQLTLHSPMPGLIVSIEAKAGEKVKQGQPLVIIEAMKMENVIKAKSDITIKSVNISAGQSVDKDEILMEFE